MGSTNGRCLKIIELLLCLSCMCSAGQDTMRVSKVAGKSLSVPLQSEAYTVTV